MNYERFLLILLLCVVLLACHQIPAPVDVPQFEVQVHFIDVGQGDAILVQAGERAMLIDGGPRESASTLLSYLRLVGVDEIDILMATHPHADHIGGLVAVLEEFPVGQVVDGGAIHTSRVFERYLEVIEERRIPFTLGSAGDRFALTEGVVGEILHPPGGFEGDLNAGSLVVRVTVGRVTFLLMGDLTQEQEDAVAVRAEILKVAHHGSQGSTGSWFLDKVSPEVAVICVGPNDYGHPHKEVMDRLVSRGTSVYRTDDNGTIVVTTDGNEYKVRLTRLPSRG